MSPGELRALAALGEAAGEVVSCALAAAADAVLTFAVMAVVQVDAWAGGGPACVACTMKYNQG
jgi:hypothetical protein